MLFTVAGSSCSQNAAMMLTLMQTWVCWFCGVVEHTVGGTVSGAWPCWSVVKTDSNSQSGFPSRSWIAEEAWTTYVVSNARSADGSKVATFPDASSETLPETDEPFSASRLTEEELTVDAWTSSLKVRVTDVFTATPTAGQTYAMHTINGQKFDSQNPKDYVRLTLGTVEEWKIVNETYGPPISHPFHIHINPFQIVEVSTPTPR